MKTKKGYIFIEVEDIEAIITKIKRVEDRLDRLVHSPIGQEERK